jgi:hypothetical protein
MFAVTAAPSLRPAAARWRLRRGCLTAQLKLSPAERFGGLRGDGRVRSRFARCAYISNRDMGHLAGMGS